MKYILLIYSNPKSWVHPMFLHERADLTQQERDDLTAGFADLLAEIAESGELLSAAPLAEPASSVVVRVRDGVPATTDGPFAESKEQLAGYFVIECESPERAAAIAARFPDARSHAVEVRPILHHAGPNPSGLDLAGTDE